MQRFDRAVFSPVIGVVAALSAGIVYLYWVAEKRRQEAEKLQTLLEERATKDAELRVYQQELLKEKADKDAELQRTKKAFEEAKHRRVEDKDAELQRAKRAADEAEHRRAKALHARGATRGDVFLRLSRLLLRTDEATWNLSQARECFVEAQRALSDTQKWLDEVQPKVSLPTSRAGYLSSLRELIGRPPTDRTWTEEWEQMTKEWLTKCRGNNHWKAAEQLQYESYATLRQKQQYCEEIQSLQVKRGWHQKNAEAWVMLSLRRDVIAQALRERDSRYAASTYAICEALAASARLRTSVLKESGREDSMREQGTTIPAITAPSSSCHGDDEAWLPLPLYRHLKGKHSLEAGDPSWGTIERPNANGFQGFTSCALTRASNGPNYFTPKGFREVIADPEDPEKITFKPRDSPIVRFESQPDDEMGLHSALIFHEDDQKVSGAFPPNTLFRLREVKEPGDWEVEGCRVDKGLESRPEGGKVKPQQKLLIVTATHRPAEGDAHELAALSGSKMSQPAITLRYATRESFIHGLDDILSHPVLTLAQEFDRDIEWEDWKSEKTGKRYNLREEWAYVTGEATKLPECTPGTRDEQNDGFTPFMFQVRINLKILRRRLHSMKNGQRPSLPTDAAYLTLEEVLAVRLYSGPAYQPINDFLRQIAWLTGDYRDQLAKHAGVTFTATVQLLCRAIRKLAAITLPWETRKPLYRAVRGELPRTFWVKDEQGLVTAVETAFMSTSSVAATCINYMQERGPNVLWQLTPRMEDDAGFHRGADISSLSQFASELETLFPPCTMLSVLEPEQYVEYKPVNAQRSSLAAGNGDDGTKAHGRARSALTPTGSGAPPFRRSSSAASPSPPSVTRGRQSTRNSSARNRWHKVLSRVLSQDDEKTRPAEVREYNQVHVLPTFV